MVTRLSPAEEKICVSAWRLIMSSISDDEADSIAPESSISQQAKTSSVTTQSLPIPDPTSIGEYFIVKDTPECLEEALPFLRKGDKVYHFLSKAKLYRISKQIGLGGVGIVLSSNALICGTRITNVFTKRRVQFTFSADSAAGGTLPIQIRGGLKGNSVALGELSPLFVIVYNLILFMRS